MVQTQIQTIVQSLIRLWADPISDASNLWSDSVDTIAQLTTPQLTTDRKQSKSLHGFFLAEFGNIQLRNSDYILCSLISAETDFLRFAEFITFNNGIRLQNLVIEFRNLCNLIGQWGLLNFTLCVNKFHKMCY